MMTLNAIIDRLKTGLTPYGDDQEDGCGQAVCTSDCGRGVTYKYVSTDAALQVTRYDILPEGDQEISSWLRYLEGITVSVDNPI